MPVYTGTPTKDGRKYFFKVSVGGQQYKSKMYLYSAEAKKAEARYLLEWRKSSAHHHTFSELIPEYLAESSAKVKPTTLRNQKTCLRHAEAVLGDVRIDKLTEKQWVGFLHHLEEQPMNNHRRNRIIEYTVAVCRYADRHYDLHTSVPAKFDKFNEAMDKPVGSKMEYWTPEQFGTFISVVDDVMYNALFTLLYMTGMRSGEALALQWQDIDFANRTVSITKTMNTKISGYAVLPPKTRSSIRTIRVPQKALERLSALREVSVAHPLFSPQSLCFGLTQAIPNSTLQKRKKQYYQKAVAIDPTLPEIRIHSLRHSCASALINAGATVTYVSKYLGHSSTKETLDTYAHFFPSEADRVADLMDTLI